MKKNSDRITSNKSKHFLVENELKKLEKFDAAYFRGKNYFDGDDRQNYLVFQGMYKYFHEPFNIITSWKSKRLSGEKISHIGGITRPPKLVYDNSRIKVKFDGSILKQARPTDFGSIAHMYIVYRLIPRTNNSNIVLESCLFGSIDITKNTDVD